MPAAMAMPSAAPRRVLCLLAHICAPVNRRGAETRPTMSGRSMRKRNDMNTKDGYRTTVEAGCTALARARDLLWASMQNAWAQLKMQFKQ